MKVLSGKCAIRALKKNARGVFVPCTLVNLFVSRKKLSLAALASEGMLRKITACSLFSLAAQLFVHDCI
jgi:hypothetical protein